MKLLLTSLAISSLGLTSAVSLIGSDTVTTQEDLIFSGTKIANVMIDQVKSDWAMGGSKTANAAAFHTFEWSDIQIDKSIVPKMNLRSSWIKLNIDYGYSDNSGKGNSHNFNSIESVIVTDSNFDSGTHSFENDRHHSGAHRLSDHQWKWQVKVNSNGIYLWDWVYVWVNGNWGNVATAKANINIKSFEYHFEFLT